MDKKAQLTNKCQLIKVIVIITAIFFSIFYTSCKVSIIHLKFSGSFCPPVHGHFIFDVSTYTFSFYTDVEPLSRVVGIAVLFS